MVKSRRATPRPLSATNSTASCRDFSILSKKNAGDRPVFAPHEFRRTAPIEAQNVDHPKFVESPAGSLRSPNLHASSRLKTGFRPTNFQDDFVGKQTTGLHDV